MDKNESSKASNLRAEIYESVDKMKNGGTLHTRIYCFQTDKPILKYDYSVNKSEGMMKQQKTKRRLFSPLVLYVMMVVKKWSSVFLNSRTVNAFVNKQT